MGLFCSLNLGVSGLIRDETSLKYLSEKHEVGDIIHVEVEEDFNFDTQSARPLVQLRFQPKENKKEFHSLLLNSLGAVGGNESHFSHLRQQAHSDHLFQNLESGPQEEEGFYFGMSLPSRQH